MIYTIQTKVTAAPYFNGQDFLLFTPDSEDGYTGMKKDQADALCAFLKKYPAIFGDPFVREMDEDLEPRYRTTEEFAKDGSFEFQYIEDRFTADDLAELNAIRDQTGNITGFDHKHIRKHA